MDDGDLAPVHNTYKRASANTLTHVRARTHTRTPTHTLGRWQVHTAAVGTKGPDSPEPLRYDPKRPRPSDQGRKVGGYFRGTHI